MRLLGLLDKWIANTQRKAAQGPSAPTTWQQVQAVCTREQPTSQANGSTNKG
ncbi:hypothetical protein amrb99_74260 [Actinomadura sp. RB99]|uniref:hypothetical protein n=1 Tax=Actinomadura sp. RB99 TaxID=2691577 RepID=UPI001681F317|nr:hypothetical protein [Actinomadura sp. RB99]MBD2898454.1 hypothetical protein [Actinomadura sp. RB99]